MKKLFTLLLAIMLNLTAPALAENLESSMQQTRETMAQTARLWAPSLHGIKNIVLPPNGLTPLGAKVLSNFLGQLDINIIPSAEGSGKSWIDKGQILI